jgi:hypothetical protein
MPVCQTCELGYGLHWDYNLFFLLYFLFNYKIKKIDDCEIKKPTQYWDGFLDHDNLIKDETKLIMKLNFQLTQYKDEKKKI